MDSQKKILPKLYPGNKEINRTWYVEYTAKDGRRKKVYGLLNKLPTVQERLAEAQRLQDEIITKDLLMPHNGLANQLLRDLQEVYDLRQPGWSSKTKSAYQTHLFAFAKWYRLQGCPAMDIRQAILFLNFISATGNNNTTRNNYRNNLKSLFASLMKFYRQRYSYNPFADIDKAPETRHTKEWFRPYQVQQLLQVIPKADMQVWLAVKIMYNCFARPNEIRQLRIADIIFDTKKLRIESLVAKTKKIRFVPIPEMLLNELAAFKNLPANYFLFGCEGVPGIVPHGRDTLSKRHKAILQNLNYENGFTFYSWKNTGAVKMLCMDKRNLRYVSKCMGHHNLDMTDKYFESLGVDEMGETIIFPAMSA